MLKGIPLYSKMEGIFKHAYLWQWYYVFKGLAEWTSSYGVPWNIPEPELESNLTVGHRPFSKPIRLGHFLKKFQPFLRLFDQLIAHTTSIQGGMEYNQAC